MAVRIASLYADIGAKTDGFKQGATEVKGGLSGLRDGFSQLGLGSVASFLTISGAIAGMVAVIKGATDKTFEYAGAVRDLAIASGTTAPEASKLLQVLDDYQITAGDVTAAMRAMKEKGIVPTIDSLADLSDKFIAIEDPAKRLKFAQDNLGRGAAQFLNVLSQGGDVIRNNSKAVEENLILTDEQIQQTERYRLELDNVHDSIDGLKVSTTLAFFDMVDKQNAVTESAKVYGTVINTYTTEGQQNMQRLGDEYVRNEELGRAWERALKDQNTALDEQAVAIDNIDYGNLISGIQDMQKETDRFTGTNDELNVQYVETKANIAALTKQYGANSNQVKAEEDKLGDLNKKLADNMTAHQKWAAQTVFSFAQARAAADGSISEGEGKVLIGIGEQLGLFDQKTADAMESVNESFSKVDASDAESTIAALTSSLKALTGQTWTININTSTSGTIPGAPGEYTGNCFVAGTLILLSNGDEIPIEKINAGDKVVTYDLETEKNVEADVTEIYHHSAAETKYYLLINDNLGVTSNHKMMTKKGWISAEDLELGDALLTIAGFEIIHSTQRIDESVPTYNLHVDHPSHNYYANGYLAHNKAGGGLVTGPGPSDMDSFLAPLANGEFVIKSSVVNKVGVDALNALNNGGGMGGGFMNYGTINVYANNPNEFMDALLGSQL